jgi:hypothetical protein
MRQPKYLAKVHTPEVAARRGKSRSAWLAGKSPGAIAEINRIRALNPTQMPGVREKISRRLKEIGHKPSARGGNGHGMTRPQQLLLDVLGDGWTAEYAVSLGQRRPGYPTCYKLDLANDALLVGIEVDGFTHASRRDQDEKKDAMLATLGWKVLRFSNQVILNWINSGMPTDASISTTLERHGILLTR